MSLNHKQAPLLLGLAGAYWCRHDEHQPWRGGGRRRRGRRGGGWLWRRRRRSVRSWRRERPRGDARFPEIRSSRFTLHEQSWRPGTVLHRHVIKTTTPDWKECFCLSVCLLVRKVRREEIRGRSKWEVGRKRRERKHRRRKEERWGRKQERKEGRGEEVYYGRQAEGGVLSGVFNRTLMNREHLNTTVNELLQDEQPGLTNYELLLFLRALS